MAWGFCSALDLAAFSLQVMLCFVSCSLFVFVWVNYIRYDTIQQSSKNCCFFYATLVFCCGGVRVCEGVSRVQNCYRIAPFVLSWQSAASWIGRRVRIKGAKGTGTDKDNVRDSSSYARYKA